MCNLRLRRLRCMCNYRLHNRSREQEAALTTSTSKNLIAVLQMTLDGRILDADGGSDWVDSWADGLELLPPVDAFVLGAGMFSGYEQFWAAMLDDPAAAAEMLGREPYPREIAYAQVASQDRAPGALDHARGRHVAERTNRPFNRGDPQRSSTTAPARSTSSAGRR